MVQYLRQLEVILGQRLGYRVEVVKGLFDGDRVVAEGAMQLYAQSLRGDTSAIEPDSEMRTLPLPWGWLIIGSSATAATLFAAGMHWQKQRSRLTSTS
ncbi:hypothetical protein L5220_06455 [Synechococcus sp. PCC 6716]|nr:hypothetical protein [Synechococcus sp. PCC 6716]